METVILQVEVQRYESYEEAYQDMTNQGVRDLGWLNSGIDLPKEGRFTKVFCNFYGTSCIYVDLLRRYMYSVDMGD